MWKIQARAREREFRSWKNSRGKCRDKKWVDNFWKFAELTVAKQWFPPNSDPGIQDYRADYNGPKFERKSFEIPEIKETEFTYSGFTGYGSRRETLLVLGKEPRIVHEWTRTPVDEDSSGRESDKTGCWLELVHSDGSWIKRTILTLQKTRN